MSRSSDCASAVPRDADLGNLQVEGVEERLRSQVQDAISRGAQLLTPEWEEGTAARPVVLSGVPHDAALLREESFGPVVCLDSFESEPEAIAMANATEYALSASVWTGDMRQGERVAAALNCGSCCVNDAIRHVGDPYASFGGNKASGFGRYRGEEGLRAFSRRKTTMLVKGKHREASWFPLNEKLLGQLAFLMRARHASGWKRFSLRGTSTMLLITLACFPGSQRPSTSSRPDRAHAFAVSAPAAVNTSQMESQKRSGLSI